MIRRLGAVLVMAIVFGTLTSCGRSDTQITAEFRDAAGLFVGNDVGVLGVGVGHVTRIDPVGTKVRVTMTVDSDVKIPADAGAVIVSRSVATDRYVELTPVYDHGPTMKSGTDIDMAKTRNPIEFDELLKSVNTLSSAVAGPDGKASAFKDVLSVGADVLQGNGDRIARTVSDLTKALDAVNGGSGDVASVLGNLDTLTKTLADNDKIVRSFSDNVTSATTMLDEDHQLMEKSFNALSAMLVKVADFVRKHRTQIGGQLDNLTSVSRTLLKDQDDLAELLETMPLMMQNVEKSVDSDGRLTFKVRPADLLPGPVAVQALCNELPVDLCSGLDLTNLSLFKILDLLAGVSK